jgi:uncharacterized membrane protein YhaH (DUF805 family)
MKRCYYSDGVETQGPVTIEELKLVEGLNPDTLVRYEGSRGWKRAGNLVELADFKFLFPSTAPVPPAAAPEPPPVSESAPTASVMRKYFYSNGADSKGPLSLVELGLLPELTPATLVWYDGLDEWMRADGLPELSDIQFASLPPPPPVTKAASVPSSSSPSPRSFTRRVPFTNPFSFNGRIRRLEYGLSLIISMCVIMLTAPIWEDSFYASLLISLIILSFSLAQGSKRCHDFGYSGRWQFLLFVWAIPRVLPESCKSSPIESANFGILNLLPTSLLSMSSIGWLPAIAFTLAMLFVKGDEGENVYGSDPKEL